MPSAKRTTAAHTSPQVVLCAPADPVAGLAALCQLSSVRTGSRSLFVTPAAKVEPDPRRPQRLMTVRSVGYRLEPEALTEC